MRFVLGFLFGLLLGGLLAVALAAQQSAAQPDDAEIFAGEDGTPAALGT